eukprot:918287-Prymnesium_polylepis.1
MRNFSASARYSVPSPRSQVKSSPTSRANICGPFSQIEYATKSLSPSAHARTKARVQSYVEHSIAQSH